MELNTIIQGDCLEEMPKIPDKSVDMILADLPYGTTNCKWDTIIPFEPLWKEYKRIIKDNGAIVLTASQPFTSALVMSNPSWYKHQWIWDKVNPSGFQLAKHQPLRQTEDVLVFGKNTINYYPIKTQRDEIKTSKHYGGKSESNPLSKIDDGFSRQYEDYYPKNILRFSNADRHNRFHDTQKPVELFAYLIKTYTNEGDLVLDNVAGSGTTGVACKLLKRNFILIEKELEYVKICEQRIKSISNPLF